MRTASKPLVPWAQCQSSSRSLTPPWNSSSRGRSGRMRRFSRCPSAMARKTGPRLSKFPHSTATTRLAEGWIERARRRKSQTLAVARAVERQDHRDVALPVAQALEDRLGVRVPAARDDLVLGGVAPSHLGVEHREGVVVGGGDEDDRQQPVCRAVVAAGAGRVVVAAQVVSRLGHVATFPEEGGPCHVPFPPVRVVLRVTRGHPGATSRPSESRATGAYPRATGQGAWVTSHAVLPPACPASSG